MTVWLAAGALGVVAWSWVGYPLALRLLAAFVSSPRPQGARPPSVSVVLPVHDAEERLSARLTELDWLRSWPTPIEVIVALDGCTDGSEGVAGDARDRGLPVRPLIVSQRRGKSNAQNEAVATATGDILVLNDVGSSFSQESLIALLEPFADPGVGYVAGDLRWRSPDTSHQVAGGLYTRLERAMWGWEAALGVLHVASGAFMAVRRELWQPLGDDVGDDAATPLDVVGQGRRGAFAPGARAVDDFSEDLGSELRARKRMTSRSLLATLRGVGRWRLWRRPALAIAIASHRLSRWTTPFWLVGSIVGSFGLWGPLVSKWAVAAGNAPPLTLVGVAGAGLLLAALPPVRRVGAFAVAFAVVNVGFAMGVWHVVAGGRIGAYATGRQE